MWLCLCRDCGSGVLERSCELLLRAIVMLLSFEKGLCSLLGMLRVWVMADVSLALLALLLAMPEVGLVKSAGIVLGITKQLDKSGLASELATRAKSTGLLWTDIALFHLIMVDPDNLNGDLKGREGDKR